MKRVRLSKLAEADLDEIWLYVAADGGVDVANRLIDDITDRIVLLGTQPNAGRLRDELAVGLRSFPVHRHIIYYRPEQGAPAVMTPSTVPSWANSRWASAGPTPGRPWSRKGRR